MSGPVQALTAVMPAARSPVLRSDYRAPAFRVEWISLCFDLAIESTEVEAQLQVRRSPQAPAAPLRLDGERLQLLSIKLDGRELKDSEFRIDESGLSLDGGQADSFVLTIRTRVRPESNSELSGLYASGDTLLTQCEARGFRRITYFPDRPTCWRTTPSACAPIATASRCCCR